ncbi:prepilin peptidase [Rhodococcoides corynebacterioides]|uniref:prepilin peptidase n=1 Tax=Rhodococcoides corynebacterioides TaxID=53972 RepID=UPI003F7EF586
MVEPVLPLWAVVAAAAVLGVLAVATIGRWTRPTPADHAAVAFACGCAAVSSGGSGIAEAAAVVALTAWAGVLCVVDGHLLRLPDELTLPAAAAVVLAADHPGTAIVGAATYAALHWLVAAAVPGAVGGGDVKLCLALGAVGGQAGTEVWVSAAVLAPILGLVAAVAAAGVGARGPYPYGPPLCAATLVAWLGAAT